MVVDRYPALGNQWREAKRVVKQRLLTTLNNAGWVVLIKNCACERADGFLVEPTSSTSGCAESTGSLGDDLKGNHNRAF